MTAAKLVGVYSVAIVLSIWLPWISVCSGQSTTTKSIYLAAETGDEAVLLQLISDPNVKVNAKGEDNMTPLHFAAKHGQKIALSTLITAGVTDINVKDKHGKTPLHYAATHGDADSVQILLDVDSSITVINAKDNHGWTPLHYASSQGNANAAKLLLAIRGIDVNARTSDERSALSYAAENGNADLVAALLAVSGIDVNLADKSGKSPLHYAELAGHEGASDLLLKANRIDVWAKDEYQWTPLHFAAYRGLAEAVKLLLEAQVDVNAKDKNGDTPLHFAAYRGNEDIVRMLLAVDGIDVNAKESSGTTPLDLAAMKGREGVVQLLLAAPGIDVNSQDPNGETALHVASDNGYEGIVRLLLAVDGIDVYAETVHSPRNNMSSVSVFTQRTRAVDVAASPSIQSLIQAHMDRLENAQRARQLERNRPLGNFSAERKPHERVQEVANRVREQFQQQSGLTTKAFTVIRYRRQEAVNGRNYMIKVFIGDTQYAHLLVFDPLKRSSNLTTTLLEFQGGKTLSDLIVPIGADTSDSPSVSFIARRPGQVPGGFSPSDLIADQNVQDIANRVRGQFRLESGLSVTEFTAVRYQRQVVAGTNYKIKVSLGSNAYAHLRVFVPLPGIHLAVLTSFEVNKSLTDPLR